VKITTPSIRASHVNSGTSVEEENVAWPETCGRVMRTPKLHAEVDAQSEVTPYGGLALVSAFVRRFKVAQTIDERVNVLKLYLPYHESDHILALAMNFYVGGTCIEDMANLQQSEAVQRLLGSCRTPDPTTAGDFLRRFDERRNQGSLEDLRSANDEVQSQVWKALSPRSGRKRKRREWAVIDMDGHTKELYGVQKEGADFSRKGQWSFHPLLVSMAGTGECLAVRNRPGNQRSCEGAADVLEDVLPRVNRHYKNVLVRGDSDFGWRDIRETCDRNGAYFAFVGREFPDRPGIANSIPERQWKPFRTRAARQKNEDRKRSDYRRRRKKRTRNRRRKRARERNYKELRQVKQWVTEILWSPIGSAAPIRLVIRRQLIEHHKGQEFLFEQYRYRYVETNLPASVSTVEVIDHTYERCDQEKMIGQMGSGLAAWRMPVAEFDGNCAWLEIARLAWNFAKWIAQLALPDEVVRWEWKRFREAWVYLAAQVTKRGRQVWVRFSQSHRFTDSLVAAHSKLQT
jgi:hypothetical protein